jgi:23S rRNA (guanine745-N1)-methyltransferase
MSAETLAEWLVCPVCAEPLSAVSASVLGCVRGHRHDINKRGYATLLGSRSRVVGDTAPMLDARARVLERGTYQPIIDSLDASLASSVGDAADTTEPPGRIVDAGAGTGYYLRSLLSTRPRARGLAMDLSPAAVARALRNADRVDGLVADTWQRLPIRDGIADVVINIFAPRNLPEFHRILAPGGQFVVVVPRPQHLHELREEGRMLDIPADKGAALIQSTGSLFALDTTTEVVFEIPYDAALADSIVAMGPSAHHAHPGDHEVDARHATVTAAVDVLTFTRR